jgi:hypothetical protein
VSGWHELVALAERELALVREGRVEELPAAQAERAALAASLGQAPAAAGPALERLAAVQQQIAIELTLARDEIGRELRRLARGRGAVGRYRAAAAG